MASVKLSSSKGQAWFCTTGLPSDAVIEVAEMSFHLHKFPLMSKSRKLHQLITKLELSPGSPSTSQEELKEVEPPHIVLPDFPGGTETFETAAKFCYGVKIDLTPWNAVPLRCAAEYLDMAEDYAEDNLVSRTERFLSHSILRGLGESIQALKSCEDVLPLAEQLGVVQRCIDSIAARAGSADTGFLFGWPVGEVAAAAAGSVGDHRPVLWNGIDTGARLRRSRARSSSSALGGAAAAAPLGAWQEDLTVLTLPIYKRVIAAMKAADPRSDLLEGSLVSYAKRSFPGLSRSSRKPSSAPVVASEAEQRDLLETLILNLPPLDAGRSRRSGLPILTAKFLAGLLRTVNIIRASEAARNALEQRLASQLEEATVDDLLLPSYSYMVETLYDVDCAERVLRHYLENPSLESGEGLVRVGKLIDGYLAEVASDANLPVEKFCDLALAIPELARVYDDGLYRAVDVYLKAHPLLVEEEREKICGVMDCQKLTLEACTHAAQNERMPLRAVVQVLFFEQLQLRQAIAGTVEAAAAEPAEEGGTWRAAVRENQVLRIDMDSMRNRVQELERDCSSMRRKVERLDGGALTAASGGGWRKFGCKFKTQVCDSHERAVVEARRNRPTERSP